jgi:hypothetical protein
VKGRELWHPRIKHWFGCRGNCPACQVAWNHDLYHAFCACGVPATGYRTLGANVDVEFFCDEHELHVPEVPGEPEGGSLAEILSDE